MKPVLNELGIRHTIASVKGKAEASSKFQGELACQYEGELTWLTGWAEANLSRKNSRLDAFIKREGKSSYRRNLAQCLLLAISEMPAGEPLKSNGRRAIGGKRKNLLSCAARLFDEESLLEEKHECVGLKDKALEVRQAEDFALRERVRKEITGMEQAGLTPRETELFNFLRIHPDADDQESANALNTSVNNVYVLKHRIRTKSAAR
jgi:DNA-binding CsgD family transcriptional regulator